MLLVIVIGCLFSSCGGVWLAGLLWESIPVGQAAVVVQGLSALHRLPSHEDRIKEIIHHVLFCWFGVEGLGGMHQNASCVNCKMLCREALMASIWIVVINTSPVVLKPSIMSCSTSGLVFMTSNTSRRS